MPAQPANSGWPGIELTTSEGSEELRRVAPGHTGVIYSSALSWYRVHSNDMQLEHRHAVRDAVGAGARPGCVPIVAFEVETQIAQTCFVTRYEPRLGWRSLQEVLDDEDLLTRIDGICAMLSRLPEWWRHVRVPLRITPAEVLISAAGEAELLTSAAPDAPPTASELLDEPERAFYLAPELFRARPRTGAATPSSIDLFVVGAALLCCFFRPERDRDAAEALAQAATGRASRIDAWRDSLPFWVVDLDSATNTVALARALADPDPTRRARLDLDQLTKFLREQRKRLDPVATVRRARTLKATHAFELVQNLLLDEVETSDLLIEGGDIGRELGKDLDAIRLYEQAIALDPDRHDAYCRRFDLIASARENSAVLLATRYRHDVETATQLDQWLRRDFDRLADIAPPLAEEREVALANHYLWRGSQLRALYDSAITFVDSRLYDADRRPKPWKLELRLIRCEALFEKGQISAARDAFNLITADIAKYAGRHQVDQASVRRASEYAHALRGRLSAALEGSVGKGG